MSMGIRDSERQIMKKNSTGIAQIVNDLFPEDCLKQTNRA